jgi:hypothetical protein
MPNEAAKVLEKAPETSLHMKIIPKNGQEQTSRPKVRKVLRYRQRNSQLNVDSLQLSVFLPQLLPSTNTPPEGRNYSTRIKLLACMLNMPRSIW